MIPRPRRFAHGSSTGAHHLQHAAVQTVDAHLRVQEAAQRVAADLDELSLSRVAEPDGDASTMRAIERAQRSVRFD